MNMNDFRVEVTDISATKETLATTNNNDDQWSFLKLNWIIYGFLDPVNMFFDNKQKQYSGWPKQYFS